MSSQQLPVCWWCDKPGTYRRPLVAYSGTDFHAKCRVAYKVVHPTIPETAHVYCRAIAGRLLAPPRKVAAS